MDEEWKRRAFGFPEPPYDPLAGSPAAAPAPSAVAPPGGSDDGSGDDGPLGRIRRLGMALPGFQAPQRPAGNPLLAMVDGMDVDEDEKKVYRSMAQFMGSMRGNQPQLNPFGLALGNALAQGIADHTGNTHVPYDGSPKPMSENDKLMAQWALALGQDNLKRISERRARQRDIDAADAFERSYLGTGSPAAGGAASGASRVDTSRDVQAPVGVGVGPAPGAPQQPAGGQAAAGAAMAQETAAALPAPAQSLFAQHLSALQSPQAKNAYVLAVRSIAQQIRSGNVKDGATIDTAYREAAKLDIEYQKAREASDPEFAARMASARTLGAKRAETVAEIEKDRMKKGEIVTQVGELYDSLERLGEDPDLVRGIGVINSSTPGQIYRGVADPKASTVQTKIGAAQHTMELIMTRLMMSGQGQITEGERKLIKDAIGNVANAATKDEYLERVRYARELMTSVFGQPIPSQFAAPSRTAEQQAKMRADIEAARKADPRDAREVRTADLVKSVVPQDRETLTAKARELASNPEGMERLKAAFDKRYGAGAADFILSGGQMPSFGAQSPSAPQSPAPPRAGPGGIGPYDPRRM